VVVVVLTMRRGRFLPGNTTGIRLPLNSTRWTVTNNALVQTPVQLACLAPLGFQVLLGGWGQPGLMEKNNHKSISSPLDTTGASGQSTLLSDT